MKDKTGRPDNKLLMTRNFHDLERRSLSNIYSNDLITRTYILGKIFYTYYGSATLTGVYDIIMGDANGRQISMTLPSASAVPFKEWTFIKKDNTSHIVRVQPASNEKINDYDYIDLTYQYQYVTIASDGTQWYIIGGMNVKLEEVMQALLTDIKLELSYANDKLRKIEIHQQLQTKEKVN